MNGRGSATEFFSSLEPQMTSEECWQRCEECRCKAKEAIDSNFQMEWIRLAEAWQRAAEKKGPSCMTRMASSHLAVGI
jgi:hypothetical protein